MNEACACLRDSPGAIPARRPWLIAGTIPDADFPLTLAPVRLHEDTLFVGTLGTTVHRGTPALLAAAGITASCLPEDADGPLSFLALVAGDTGDGRGSFAVYEKLTAVLPELRPAGMTFHYLMPDVDWHNRILLAVDALREPPLLAADAGFMYAAKMSGYADKYDLFTPDIGELAFLADEKAPHPFYTRNFFLADEGLAPELIKKAHEHGNAARHMLVKGLTDRYVYHGEILDSVEGPDVPALEPIGGTGDTVTGIATACLAAGMPMRRACLTAMRANRHMGKLSSPTAASSIADLLRYLPQALAL